MRQNVRDRLNKKLSDNDMVTLNNDAITLNNDAITLNNDAITLNNDAITLNNDVESVPTTLSDTQQEQLNQRLYENYSTLQEVEPYPGHLQAIIQDDGKLFMVLLFVVGAFVIHELIKSKNISEANRK